MEHGYLGDYEQPTAFFSPELNPHSCFYQLSCGLCMKVSAGRVIRAVIISGYCQFLSFIGTTSALIGKYAMPDLDYPPSGARDLCI